MLTVSSAESLDSATTDSAQSGSIGSVQALQIKFTPTHEHTNKQTKNTFSQMCHEVVLNPPAVTFFYLIHSGVESDLLPG